MAGPAPVGFPVLIEKILPHEVAGAEEFGDPPDAVLYPGEAELLTRAVDKRRREFRTVRHCARQALRRLGVPPAPVLRGERGEPHWPAGIVGSMTHCSGYRAAAVARGSDLHALGIDAEPNEPLPEGVLDVIALGEERDRLTALISADAATHWDRILFCAKESVYKAWFPLTRCWLGFEDAAVTINPGDAGTAAGTFTVRLLVSAPDPRADRLAHVTGRWVRGNGLVITAIALPTTP